MFEILGFKMNYFVKIVFFASILSFIPLLVKGEPIIKENISYYLVYGKDVNEIRSSLNNNTPIRQDGIAYDGHTDCYFKWNFWWNESNGLCSIDRVKVFVEIQYTLPKLNNPNSLLKRLKNEWEAYIKALVKHENGHRDIAVRLASEIENEIVNILPRQSCKQLEIDANQIGYDIIEKANHLNEEYDRETNHGNNQGAIFPKKT